MSRIAGAPIELPKGVEVNISGSEVSVKGPKGQLSHSMHELVEIVREDERLKFSPSGDDPRALAITGTTRSLVNNMVTGVTAGFERKLELVGVGYRAQIKGNTLNLALGYSHPIDFPVPEGVSIETPTQTEIMVRGIDKQKVGQTAAVIRGFRPPEPYKGKGVKYADEVIVRKEAKKK